MGILSFRERFPLTYKLNDIFFCCLGVALHENIKIDPSEIQEAVFMDLNQYAQTPSFDTGNHNVKRILQQIQKEVDSVDKLKAFMGLDFIDMKYDKELYNDPTKGRFYLSKKHFENQE